MIQPGMLVKINKPENISDYPTWVEKADPENGMDSFDGEIIRAPLINHHELGTYILYKGWSFSINWLTIVNKKDGIL